MNRNPLSRFFFETGPSFKVSGQAKSIAHYANDHPLLSGWILGGKYLDDTSAIAEVPIGRGKVITFGFIPIYRGLSEVTYKFLLNAMLYGQHRALRIDDEAKRSGSSHLHAKMGGFADTKHENVNGAVSAMLENPVVCLTDFDECSWVAQLLDH
ncbi:MAG: hypothetical protein ABSA39_17735 [Edaphobacter sp.]